MVTKVEREDYGIKRKEKSGKKPKDLINVARKKEKRQDGDAEAGVDRHDEQLNDTPNDPAGKGE